MRKKILWTLFFIIIAAGAAALAASGCAQTSHNTKKAALGGVLNANQMEADFSKAGPIVLERIIAADWEVKRSGLINLESQAAKDAQLEDGDEPIQVYMYALKHPEHGLFLIDTITPQRPKTKRK